MFRWLTWSRFGLFLRLTLAWYVAQVLATVLVGSFAGALVAPFLAGKGTDGGDLLLNVTLGGIGAGFMGALLLFPYTSILVGLVGTVLQVRATGSGPLGAFHQVRIQVPMPPGEAIATCDALLRDLGAIDLHRQGDTLQARFTPATWARPLGRWALTDEWSVIATPGALQIDCHPSSRLLYQGLWVDRGRTHARLTRFQDALGEHLARLQQAERETHRLTAQEARLAQAELLLLRAQVEPHFLFNTLAHLRELVRTGDTSTALAMVDALVLHARTATHRVHRVSQSLGDEAASIEAYLAMMQLRFEHRMTFHLDIPADLHGVDVPVGSLLIPVENAIKHGLEPRRGGGTITVTGHRTETHLVLDVLDDGVGLGTPSATGSGLSNLRQRLKLAHGDTARLTVEGRDEGGVQVRLALPLA